MPVLRWVSSTDLPSVYRERRSRLSPRQSPLLLCLSIIPDNVSLSSSGVDADLNAFEPSEVKRVVYSPTLSMIPTLPISAAPAGPAMPCNHRTAHSQFHNRYLFPAIHRFLTGPTRL